MTEPTMTAKSGLKVSLIRAKPEHALELYEVIASDRDHLKNLTWAATIGLKGVLEHCLKPNVFLIRINRERVAGCLEFREQPDGWTMIGYWVGKEFSGQGVAQQALSLAITMGHIDQHLFGCVREANIRSRKVLESAGFRIFETVNGWHRLTRIDADCFISPDVIVSCAERIRAARAKNKKLWFVPYRRFYRLSKEVSEQLIASDYAHPMELPSNPPNSMLDEVKGISHGHWFGALIQLMPREAFYSVGGMDERFRGWGGEDVSFMRALDTVYSPHKSSNNPVYHIWHPKLGSQEGGIRLWVDQSKPNNNGNLASRYSAAFNDRERMLALVRENQG